MKEIHTKVQDTNKATFIKIMNGTIVNEIDFKALKQLSQKRDQLKAVEKKYFDFESPKEYLKANKLRKKTEKAIFKLIKEL